MSIFFREQFFLANTFCSKSDKCVTQIDSQALLKNYLIYKIESQKLPAMVLCLGEPPRRFLLYLWYSFFFASLIFIFVVPLIFIFVVICQYSSFAFTFRHHPSPFRGLSPGLHPFDTFSTAHCRVICNTFIFNHSDIFLPQALRFWVGVFYSQAFFTLRSFTDILTQNAFIKSSLGAGSSSLKFAGLHTDPQTTDSAHLLVWFTVLHESFYTSRFYLRRRAGPSRNISHGICTLLTDT